MTNAHPRHDLEGTQVNSIRMRGTKQSGMIGGLLVPVGILGIFVPLRSGPAWVTNNLSLTLMGWLPLFMVISMIADSFAGERERQHTLGNLVGHASIRPGDSSGQGSSARSFTRGGWWWFRWSPD